MKLVFLPILFFLSVHQLVYGQRTKRSPEPWTTVYQPATFEGRYFNVTLTNNDSIPILLKLGVTKQITNGDTLNLARTYPCSSPTVGEYYDLHNLVSEEDNCVSWYTLQQMRPKDTLRFVVKLKDFDKSATSRFYYCYTREIKNVDRELQLYTETEKIYMMKENRDFETNFVAIDKNALNTGFAKVGLNIYISASNQQ